MDKLNHRFDKHTDTKIYSDYSKMDQVKDSEHYWAMNNCNHLTMRWLRKLDCRVDGFGIMSHFTTGEIIRTCRPSIFRRFSANNRIASG